MELKLEYTEIMEEGMNVEDFSFSFGAVLLLAALLGGGVEVIGYKFPKFTLGIRITVGFFGAIFLAIGFLFLIDILPYKTEPPKLITFSISDDLGDRQRGEEIIFFLNGKQKGRLHVDGKNSKAILKVEAKPGKNNYRLEGMGQFKIDNVYQNIKIIGHGTLNVNDGDKLVFINTHINKAELIANFKLVPFIELIDRDVPPEGSIIKQLNSVVLTKINGSEYDLRYDAIVFNNNNRDTKCVMKTDVVQKKNGQTLRVIASKDEDVLVKANSNQDVSGILEMKEIPPLESEVEVIPEIIVTCDFAQ